MASPGGGGELWTLPDNQPAPCLWKERVGEAQVGVPLGKVPEWK